MQEWEERLLWNVGNGLNLGAEPSCTHRGREGREGAACVHPERGAVFRTSCCVNKEPPVLWGADVGLCEPPLAFWGVPIVLPSPGPASLPPSIPLWGLAPVLWVFSPKYLVGEGGYFLGGQFLESIPTMGAEPPGTAPPWRGPAPPLCVCLRGVRGGCPCALGQLWALSPPHLRSWGERGGSQERGGAPPPPAQKLCPEPLGAAWWGRFPCSASFLPLGRLRAALSGRGRAGGGDGDAPPGAAARSGAGAAHTGGGGGGGAMKVKKSGGAGGAAAARTEEELGRKALIGPDDVLGLQRVTSGACRGWRGGGGGWGLCPHGAFPGGKRAAGSLLRGG